MGGGVVDLIDLIDDEVKWKLKHVVYEYGRSDDFSKTNKIPRWPQVRVDRWSEWIACEWLLFFWNNNFP